MDTYRIGTVGAAGVGKTTLILSLLNHHHWFEEEEYDPTIQDLYKKQLVLDNNSILLEFFDFLPSHHSSFSLPLCMSMLRSCEGFVFVYSITSRSSFEDLEGWFTHIFEIKDEAGFPLVVCGNKCDLKEEYRQIEEEEGKQKAKGGEKEKGFVWGGEFFETSGKTRENVEEAYYALVRGIRRRREEGERRRREREERRRKKFVLL